MSKVHKPSIERIKTPVNGDGLLALYDALVEEAEEFDNEVQQVCMPFVEEGDKFEPGTYVPELWLVVRKVLPDEEEK